ncbi:hypothetical protein A3736_01680 [Erythrobacter sp. HI0063]|jgi:hypothetical protein|uniref:hypothetical protein n=1 Tax=Erythrobacter sp. HI0063 TaxID=1822240 RepID=UPI0007C3D35C|nr:hypothetical protein A3736_01680 [Erythrobacter sp. HI0063]
MDRLGGEFGAHDGGFEPDRHSDPLADPFDLDDESAYEDDDSDDFGPPSPVGQDERRMQVRAYNLWASQLGDNAFPSIDTLDPESIEDFGPYSVLLDFSDGLDDPVLRHIGAELAKECSADDAMARLSDVPSRSLLSRITDHYMQILANQAPIGFEAEFLNERGNTALYRGILLPYSSEPDDNRATGEPAKIDFIYGVINWKELADQAMADELLLEIGQALEGVSLPNEAPDDVLELGTFAPSQDESEDEPDAAVDMLPRPSFGTASPDRPARIKRPALPTPDYAAEAENEPDPSGEEAESDDSESWAIGERASDYGLAEEWDEPDYEDVDDVVDPLADDGVGLGLASLVSRGTRRASEVIMPSQNTMGDFPEPSAAPIPQAYEPEPVVEPFEEAAPVELDHSEPEGLYDCLAEARDLAHAAQSSEDRSRTALYNAVGRAYDFSLEAQSDPEGFAEIIADNGLTVQDRAPMTPVVKLVFGADYDKTRLTEYAAVLSHAHRTKLARGSLARFLMEAEGGLKGVVREERRLRREEAGKPALDAPAVRAELAEILRRMDPIDLADLAPDGPEFALVVIRRDETGTLDVIGEVPEDIALIERAARKLA